jgi:hypothetical protein
MAETASLKTIEEIQAEFVELTTNKGEKAETKDLASKLLHNNYKMCLFAELYEKEVEDTTNKNAKDPKIELFKNAQDTLDILKQLYETTMTENSELKDELMDMKLKRKQKRYFTKNREMFVNYREKMFPMLMQDCDKKEELIEELNKNASGNISETDLEQVTEELEKVTKENELLVVTEANITEARRQNEVIEVETCRIQVRNIEMENEIRTFDEYDLENKITEMEDKMKNNPKASTSKLDEEKNKSEFKNPNDFPALLDFLDKSKKLKQKKKKRKLFLTPNPLSKRRKEKAGSFSPLDKDGNPPKDKQPPSPARSSKNQDTNKQPPSPARSSNNQVRVMESIGLKMKIGTGNKSENSNRQPSEPSNMLQRTYASRNLGKSSSKSQFPLSTWSPNAGSSNSSRPPLQRQNSTTQLTEKPKTPVPTPNRPARRKAYDELEKDENGYLLLQRFTSGPLFPQEPEIPKPKPQAKPKVINQFSRPDLYDRPSKAVPAKSGSIERLETIMNVASISKQPSFERGLRPRKNLKSQKISPKKVSPKKVDLKHDKKVSPKKADMINDRKEAIRKKLQSKSPKKEVKKGRGRKKIDKSANNEMIVDEDSSSTDDKSNENQMIIDDNISMTSGDNAEKLMAVDENPVIAEQLMVVDQNPIIENSVNVTPNATLIAESTGNDGMDVDNNAQILGNDDTNMPEILSNDAEEVNMEEASPENISNIEIFDMEMENVDPEASVEMSKSFERLFCSSPTSSGNLELNKSFDFDLDNSRELSGSDSGGNKVVDDFFNFDTNPNEKDDFFGDGSFKSNEGKADDFF